MSKNILVTGMSGLIGGIAGRHLAKKYNVRALNRRDVPGFETVRGDISDLASIQPAFDGVDTVVHMAAYLGPDNERHLAVNATGTYNVFEAARQAGVKRVVFGSSGAVQAAVEKDEPIRAMTEARMDDVPTPRPLVTHESPIRPSNMYGAVKLFGEALGKAYSESHGMSVLCIRLGRVRQGNRPENSREASVYLSHRDAAQMVEKCVDAADSVRFGIFYAVSDNFSRFRDIEHAREVIGYVPQDGIPAWPLPDGWEPSTTPIVVGDSTSES